jgi:hypothetical protein
MVESSPPPPKQKAEKPFEPGSQVTLDQIKSLNPLRSFQNSSLVSSLSGDNPLERVFKFVDSALFGANRLSKRKIWYGIIVRNDTSPQPGQRPFAVLPESSGDVGYRSSLDRGVVRVYIPELHSHLPNPDDLPGWAGPNDGTEEIDWQTALAITELYPRCYGPADFLRHAPPGTPVKIKFPIKGIYEEGKLIVPQAHVIHPGNIIEPGTKSGPSPPKSNSTPRQHRTTTPANPSTVEPPSTKIKSKEPRPKNAPVLLKDRKGTVLVLHKDSTETGELTIFFNGKCSFCSPEKIDKKIKKNNDYLLIVNHNSDAGSIQKIINDEKKSNPDLKIKVVGFSQGGINAIRYSAQLGADTLLLLDPVVPRSWEKYPFPKNVILKAGSAHMKKFKGRWEQLGAAKGTSVQIDSPLKTGRSTFRAHLEYFNNYFT